MVEGAKQKSLQVSFPNTIEHPKQYYRLRQFSEISDAIKNIRSGSTTPTMQLNIFLQS